jgi:hypothetical protein
MFENKAEENELLEKSIKLNHILTNFLSKDKNKFR